MEEKTIQAYNKVGGFISSITFNEGTTIEFNPNDIVLFVGPNNAGKSQALKDIYTISETKKPTVVVSDISIQKSDSDISTLLDKISKKDNLGDNIQYSLLNKSYHYYGYTMQNFRSEKYFKNFRSLFMILLNTDNRLNICNPVASISRTMPKTHPIHYAAFDSEYRKWLSDSFYRAFNNHLIPNTQFGNEIPLCIGQPVKFNQEYEDEQIRQEEYAKILENYPQVHLQGDGVRSFTGILLYLMMQHICTFLIDEPESFLHPPQANIMGQIIGESLSNNQQAFISTHSEEFIKGLLSSCPDRIKIIRITRDNDNNTISVLKNDNLKLIWNDPLLKYSNIMSGLFHKTVVLCESDSDCKLYSAVDDFNQKLKGRYSETLFIHCGGKHRMDKIVTALKSLNVDVKLIPDFDVLNSEDTLKKITESFNINWDIISKDYHIFESNIGNTKESINRSVFKAFVNDIIDNSNNKVLSKSERESITNELKLPSKWDNLKKVGIQGLPAGDCASAFERMNAIFKSHGIYIVPVGELECFIKTVGGHGPEWTNKVLETYPDFNNTVYDSIKQFIAEVLE